MADVGIGDSIQAASRVARTNGQRDRLFTSWKLWTSLLVLGLLLMVGAVSIPAYQRMQALEYLDRHEGHYEFAPGREWLTQWFGDRAKCLRNVYRITCGRDASDDLLTHISALHEVSELSLNLANRGPNPISEAGIRAFGTLDRVEVLALSGSWSEDRVSTDQTIAALLAACPVLTRLEISGAWLSNRSLQKLSAISSIVDLSLHVSFLNSDELVGLSALPDLERANLEVTTLNDSLIDWIRQSPKLRVLELTRTQATDESLSRLLTLSELEDLRLPRCDRITEEGLRHLTHLPRLKNLTLSGELITSETIEILKQIPSLDVLEVWDSLNPDLEGPIKENWRVRLVIWEPYCGGFD